MEAVRAVLLSDDRPSRVFRELWDNGSTATYLGLRSYLRQHGRSGRGSKASGPPSAHMPVGSTYTFDGVRYVLDASSAAITVVCFAKMRNDLLAFGNAAGCLWFAQLHELQPVVTEAPRMHRKPISGADWSFDASQLLTCGDDGVCIWDAVHCTCIRSIALLVPVKCCRFHALNSNMAMVGTASGLLELYNCSTGTLYQKYPAQTKHVQVTALESSPHHVFAGDSSGRLQLYRCEMSAVGGQLQRLVAAAKLAVAAPSATSPVIALQFLPFCTATDSPVLLAATRDSTISIVKVLEHHKLQVHTQVCVAPMARDIRPEACPLSVIQGLPRVTMGSEDTCVYIYNVSSVHPKTRRPLTVTSLRGHRSPVVAVSWAYDESLLASADCDGTVIVWKRSAG